MIDEPKTESPADKIRRCADAIEAMTGLSVSASDRRDILAAAARELRKAANEWSAIAAANGSMAAYVAWSWSGVDAVLKAVPPGVCPSIDVVRRAADGETGE